MTVRKAVDMLIEWGLVERRHGSGTYVTKKDVQHETKGLSGFTELMREQGRSLTSEVLEFRTMPAPPAIASQLRIKVNEPVYFSNRVRSVDGRALLVEESYMPVRLFRTLSVAHLEDPSSPTSRTSASSPSPATTRASAPCWPTGAWPRCCISSRGAHPAAHLALIR